MTASVSLEPQRQSSPHRPPSLRILGSRVDRLSLSDVLEAVRRFLTTSNIHQIVTANTLMLLAAEHDSELARIIDRAALVVPESWGVAWASRRAGAPLSEFIPGIDLMQALCALARDERRRIYLLGAKPGVAEVAAQSLQTRFPGLALAGTHHGYFSTDEEPVVLEEIRQMAPDFLFVGLTVPGQEKWIAHHLSNLGVRVVMGVGGSFDVLSGRLRRAPSWMRRLGVEWTFRLLQEPWRWRRIAQLPVFMWKVIRWKKE
jgi:N-acetylglucosaminyldiphosphoundecaprenol N-acetyl-beta-D-mannosaminyltransferase